MRENLGRVFRDARKRKGVTQEELAEQIGVQTRMILEIENGRGNPKFDNLFAAMRLLDIPSRDIFYYDRTISDSTEKFFLELSAFSEAEQRIALSAVRAVLEQFHAEKEDG